MMVDPYEIEAQRICALLEESDFSDFGDKIDCENSDFVSSSSSDNGISDNEDDNTCNTEGDVLEQQNYADYYEPVECLEYPSQ